MASIKSAAIWLLLIASTTVTKAQSFSFGDLFGQAGKQKKNYEAQLLALQAFESELKQAYNVIRNGLSGIRDINTAELNAHNAYYQSLKQPGNAVKNNPQVQDILTWQSWIVKSFNQSFTGLTDDEQNYIRAVRDNLLAGCNADLTCLQNLLTAGEWQMTDDERLKRLSKIHAAVLDRYEFTRGFCNAAKVLAAQRQQGMNETQTLKDISEKN